MGAVGISLVLGFQCLGFVLDSLSLWWLSRWSEESDEWEAKNASQPVPYNVSSYYIKVYASISVTIIFNYLFKSLGLAWAGLQASRFLHQYLLFNLVKAPMKFFDTTPFGRILNRFSKDIATIDDNIPRTFSMWMACFLSCLMTLFFIVYATPWVGLCIIPLLVVYYVVQRFYVASSRQLKRLESVTKSPIYNQFGETLAGVSTIRAFGSTQSFIDYSKSLVDKNQRCYYFNVTSNRWLATRLEIVANTLVLMSAAFCTISKGSAGFVPALAALAINQALSITQTLNWFVRQQSEIETHIVSVERVKEYAEIPTEKYESEDNTSVQAADTKTASDTWPEQGLVKFDNYSTRYREELDLVVKNIDINIAPGERVGIVGRTGAGKSSLTMALFRIIEPAEGTIKIDDVDITNIDLNKLRSKLTIIPQDPVLWTGSIRYNLDPLNLSDDATIWKALEQANLKEYIENHPDQKGLDHMVSEGGENFSVGQRQLFCLARALLRKSKVLVMDEATAAVDPATDNLVQNTIRTEFKNWTVLTIAHRLNTIIDYDKILVLDKGLVNQFGSPEELLKDKEGIFYSLCHEAGLA